MSQGHKGKYRADWLREEPYSLAELTAYIPLGWRRPIKQPLTVYGRNDALFREGMKWSGLPRNWGKWAALETHLWAMNASFIEPLNARELAGIVKSVIKYQRCSLGSGKQQQTFSFIQAARGGQSKKSVAREHGLTPKAVRKIIYREGRVFPSVKVYKPM